MLERKAGYDGWFNDKGKSSVGWKLIGKSSSFVIIKEKVAG